MTELGGGEECRLQCSQLKCNRSVTIDCSLVFNWAENLAPVRTQRRYGDLLLVVNKSFRRLHLCLDAFQLPRI